MDSADDVTVVEEKRFSPWLISLWVVMIIVVIVVGFGAWGIGDPDGFDKFVKFMETLFAR